MSPLFKIRSAVSGFKSSLFSWSLFGWSTTAHVAKKVTFLICSCQLNDYTVFSRLIHRTTWNIPVTTHIMRPCPLEWSVENEWFSNELFCSRVDETRTLEENVIFDSQNDSYQFNPSIIRTPSPYLNKVSIYLWQPVQSNWTQSASQSLRSDHSLLLNSSSLQEYPTK